MILWKTIYWSAKYEKARLSSPSRAELLALQAKAAKDSPWLALPFAVMINTRYDGKAAYPSILPQWERCREPEAPWALLALANTLEQMDIAVYEHWRALSDLLGQRAASFAAQSPMANTAAHLPAGDAAFITDEAAVSLDDFSSPDGLLAGLALLKACHLEALPCRPFARTGHNLFLAARPAPSAAQARYAKIPAPGADACPNPGHGQNTDEATLRGRAAAIWAELFKLWGDELLLPPISRCPESGRDPAVPASGCTEKGCIPAASTPGGSENTLTLLHKTPRSLVFELPGDALYDTEEYEIRVNGTFLRKDSRMVAVLHGLLPDTVQEIRLSRKGKPDLTLTAKTEPETATLNVRRFGARGDGAADDTGAIQAAIFSCPPGGRVYIPRGVYRIRNLFLKSNLVLEIGRGAVLQGFQSRDAFPVLPGRTPCFDGSEGFCASGEYLLGVWEGNPLDSMASLLAGIDLENLVICGEGVIDGGGCFGTWWRNPQNTCRPFRPRMLYLVRCRNVTVQGIRIQNSPSWNLHPFFCDKIRFYGIELASPGNSQNTDGIDPESCQDVEIAGVHFSVGDDCIAIKSGKIYLGRAYKRPSKNIRVRHCLMEKGHGAVTIGSEIAGGVYDVSVSKCLFLDTDRGLRIKTRRGRGALCVVDGISFDRISMDRVKAPFVVNCFYFCDPDGMSDYVASKEPLPADERTPEICRLSFTNIRCRNAHWSGVYLYGLPERKIREAHLENIDIFFAPDAEWGTPAMMRDCPKVCRLGILAENIEKLRMKNVRIDGKEISTDSYTP